MGVMWTNWRDSFTLSWGGLTQISKPQIITMDSQAENKSLDSLTDRHDDEQIEIKAGALTGLSSKKAIDEEKMAHQQALAAVTVNKADKEYIINELEVDDLVADSALREANGDLKKAVVSIVNQ